MPVMDEFKEERAALKQATIKEKFSYFWEYYKWHTIVIIAAVIFVSTLIYQMVTQKDNAIYVAMLNTVETESSEEYTRQFTEYAGINTDKYNVLIDTSMYIDLSDMSKLDERTLSSNEKLLVYIAAGDVDVVISNETTLLSYAYNGAFYDLRTILTEEQIARYEPYFFYIDQNYADQLGSQVATIEDYNTLSEYPLGRNPETMETPVPVGIYLDTAEKLKENYFFLYENMILSIPGNTKNLDMVSTYLDFVLP